MHFPKMLSIALCACLVALALPAAAREVVDFARNAGKIDGFSAVSARPGSEGRQRKLVATNRRGYLPNDILKRAQDSDKLGGISRDQYARRCGIGSLNGSALIPPDVSSDWQAVPGFGSVARLPNFCGDATAMARRLDVGTYLVRMTPFLSGPVLASCSPDGAELIRPLSITVGNPRFGAPAEPLIANYGAACDEEMGLVVEVRIWGVDGEPRDAGFSMMEGPATGIR